MIFPDMSNYVFDDISLCFGFVGGLGFCLILFFCSSIIKCAFRFARWYITRKSLRKSSAEVIEHFNEVINREDG